MSIQLRTMRLQSSKQTDSISKFVQMDDHKAQLNIHLIVVTFVYSSVDDCMFQF